MGNWEKAYQKWAQAEGLDPGLRGELEELQQDEGQLENAFFEDLTFGTGGMRGILGPGTNRMNIYTVRKAVKGLATYLEENAVNYKDRGVVVAYDSRYMSQEFALECAKVLGYHGIKTYVFTALQPTPVLSFAVRYLGTVAGIMITASHNPPEYNGLKVYNDAGSQILAEADEMIHHMNQVGDEFAIPVVSEEKLDAEKLLEWLNGEVGNAYLAELLHISKWDKAGLAKEKDLEIVFTPLHGTAGILVPEGLKQLNFTNVHSVEAQAIPDPEFSTVASPNPEEHQAFTEAIKLGKEKHADILLATDPDADRLGVAVKNASGEYQVLTGNQLGSLLLDYILRHTNEQILPNARMIKTIVTTEFGRAIAASFGVQTLDTLTGFKYISEKINEYDATGETFVFGYEESYGYLISGFARDKDAVQAAVMACEMAVYWKEQGFTLLEALNNLYEEHGFFKEGLDGLTLDGKAGKEQIEKMVDDFRGNERSMIGTLKTICIEDYQARTRIFKDGTKKIESLHLPQENVIKYMLEDQCWVCLRPSGTEPKIKWYYGAHGKTEEEVDQKVNMLEQALKDIFHKAVAKGE